jgi:hypothetical protein
LNEKLFFAMVFIFVLYCGAFVAIIYLDSKKDDND